jgi:hypothetical protein
VWVNAKSKAEAKAGERHCKKTDGFASLPQTGHDGRAPVEKRSVFLERVAAQLQLRGRFTDLDFDDAARLALRGLIQESAA